MWIDLFERAKNVKTFVSHMNAHQQVTSSEKDFNYQVDRTTHFMDINQPIFPTTPSLPSGVLHNLAIVAGMEVIHRFSNVNFH